MNSTAAMVVRKKRFMSVSLSGEETRPTLAAVNSLPHPAGGLGDAPLELAGVFADEEW